MRQFRIDASACLMGALAVLMLPLRWLISALTAAIFHELCHILAVRLSGEKILRVTVGATGTVMETGPMGPVQEMLCALAGPAGSFLLLLLARWLPMIAVCGFLQGLFNLLPVYPLDGGRMLRGLTGIFLTEPSAERFMHWVQTVFFSAVIAFSLYLRMGMLPVLLVLVWCQRTLFRKKPCKPGKQAVQ